jgi:hypothetical protein
LVRREFPQRADNDGVQYCPYCATERWAFHGAAFTSTTIAFTRIEEQSNQVVNANHARSARRT